MNWENIRAFFDIIATGGLVIAGLIYWRSQSTKAKNIAEKDLNDTLNELLEARDKKIKDLEELAIAQGKEIDQMKETIEILSSKKTDLEALVILALKDYFSTHPEVAHAQQEKENKNSKNI
jgi:6-phosphogluconate dehydrogenase